MEVLTTVDLNYAVGEKYKPLSILLTGEWKAQFDPRFTTRSVFYLDDKHMVDVEMMEAAKYPLSLFNDNELDAQVTHCAGTQSLWFNHWPQSVIKRFVKET